MIPQKELKDKIEDAKEIIDKMQKDLAEMVELKKDYEKQLFYTTTEYREKDIVIIKTRGRTKTMTEEREAVLGVKYGTFGWEFVAYFQKLDGEYTNKHKNIYDINTIIRKVGVRK